ncbi:DUF1236 domain-containing protein [Bradyrhizobium retamae]|uniref:DUF1236 domain-containing protein n=1 Tax=Bradyrhizobium retamae TaxID=1300035 RepID=A0A0R3NCC2_9BRAD|nr:DUF1236 domain-containing protein [Bradyrhizobium retamae]KRR27653.1 hypothetical protein CQ13_04545 [Bradyrhizobium retamae]
MPKDLSRNGEREGTRKLLLGGSVIAAVVFVGLFAWFAVPQLLGTTDYLGRPSTGADKGTAATTVGTSVPTQREAESAVAKNDPAGTEDRSGGRARNIKQSSQPVSLTQEQRDKLRAIFSSAGGPKIDRPNFEMMIGTSVPRQTELADLPPEATQVLNGYWGSQYIIAGKDLVVVDQNSRRVAAIIAGVR